MELKTGGKYLDRTGKQQGPLVHDGDKAGGWRGFYRNAGGRGLWRRDGRLHPTYEQSGDLVSEVSDEGSQEEWLKNGKFNQIG